MKVQGKGPSWSEVSRDYNEQRLQFEIELELEDDLSGIDESRVILCFGGDVNVSGGWWCLNDFEEQVLSLKKVENGKYKILIDDKRCSLDGGKGDISDFYIKEITIFDKVGNKNVQSFDPVDYSFRVQNN